MNIPNTCKRGCCWNPYGTCALQHECDHHKEDQAEEQAQQVARELDRDLAQAAQVRRGARAWSR